MSANLYLATAPAGVPAATVGLSPGELLFLAPPGDTPSVSALRATVRRLAVQAEPGPPGAVRFAAAELGAEHGKAIAHVRHGQIVVYCDHDDITGNAVAAMTVLASRAVAVAAARLAGEITGVRVRAISCSEIPDEIHPAVCLLRASDIELIVCADLITPALAEALTCVAGTPILAAANASRRPAVIAGVPRPRCRPGLRPGRAATCSRPAGLAGQAAGRPAGAGRPGALAATHPAALEPLRCGARTRRHGRCGIWWATP